MVKNRFSPYTSILPLRRQHDDWSVILSPAGYEIDRATDRGFTGHEMLDTVDLVHMNGRIYDPVLGRFLSADPHIQQYDNLQNHNRYSYVLNNPLSYTDPSGYFFDKLFSAIKNFFKRLLREIITILLASIPVIGPFLAAAYRAYLGYREGGFLGAVQGALGPRGPPGGSGGTGGNTSVVIWNFQGADGDGGGGFLRTFLIVAAIVADRIIGADGSDETQAIGGGKYASGAGSLSFQFLGYGSASSNFTSPSDSDLGYFARMALGMIVDMLPIVGGIKGFLDLLAGQDIITGEKIDLTPLAILTLILAAIPGIGAAIKLIRNLKKKVDTIRKTSKAVTKGGWTPTATEKHHTIPREIQKKLPPETRSHPDVRGRRGNPNKKDVAYEKHREIHKGPGGGDYNRRFDEEIQKRGGYENVSPQDLNDIRDGLVDEFGI